MFNVYNIDMTYNEIKSNESLFHNKVSDIFLRHISKYSKLSEKSLRIGGSNSDIVDMCLSVYMEYPCDRDWDVDIRKSLEEPVLTDFMLHREDMGADGKVEFSNYYFTKADFGEIGIVSKDGVMFRFSNCYYAIIEGEMVFHIICVMCDCSSNTYSNFESGMYYIGDRGKKYYEEKKRHDEYISKYCNSVGRITDYLDMFSIVQCMLKADKSLLHNAAEKVIAVADGKKIQHKDKKTRYKKVRKITLDNDTLNKVLLIEHSKIKSTYAKFIDTFKFEHEDNKRKLYVVSNLDFYRMLFFQRQDLGKKLDWTNLDNVDKLKVDEHIVVDDNANVDYGIDSFRNPALNKFGVEYYLDGKKDNKYDDIYFGVNRYAFNLITTDNKTIKVACLLESYIDGHVSILGYFECDGKKEMFITLFLDTKKGEPKFRLEDMDMQAYCNELLDVYVQYSILQSIMKNKPSMVKVVNERVVVDEVADSKKSRGSNNSNSGKRNSVRIVKEIVIRDTAQTGKGRGTKHNMQCPSWGVIGHYRKYKNGKVVWIAPYKKGKQRSKPNAYKPKDYNT